MQARYLVGLPQDYKVSPEELKVSSGLWCLLGLGAMESTDHGSDIFSLQGSDGRLTDE